MMGPLTAIKCLSWSRSPQWSHAALQRYLGQDVVPQIAQHAAGVGQLGAAQVDLVVCHHPYELKDLLPAGDEAGAKHVVDAEGLDGGRQGGVVHNVRELLLRIRRLPS